MNFSGTSAMTMKFCFRCVWWPNMWRRWEWLWKMIWIVVNDFILCWKIFTLFILYSLFGYLHSLCASFFCWIFWRDIYWAVENISVIFEVFCPKSQFKAAKKLKMAGKRLDYYNFCHRGLSSRFSSHIKSFQPPQKFRNPFLKITKARFKCHKWSLHCFQHFFLPHTTFLVLNCLSGKFFWAFFPVFCLILQKIYIREKSI